MVPLVTTLVVVAIFIIIGVLVFGQVNSSIDKTDWDADMNQTVDDLEDTFFDSVDLTAVGLIVLAATVILAVLLGGLARGRQ